MTFNSYIYILLFLPIVVTCYFLANKLNNKLGKIVLIISSIIFYVYSNISQVEVILISVVINYSFSLCIRKSKWKKFFLFIPIIINITLLLWFKYTNFAIISINTVFAKDISLLSIIQPLGISFFTFQQISYLVSTCKGTIDCSILNYVTYILYFPKILMGPLIEPDHFYQQINDLKLKRINWNNIAYGMKIFSYGLFKKMLFADTFGKAVSWGFTNFEITTSLDWIFIALFYTFQIYFDFSGYSDMAVGSSLMLNITLPINFNSPYKAISVRDFWKRWHISLTKFLTKYIYIPLGGSRHGKKLIIINTIIVFLISGIWHGANYTFILWGVVYGVLSVFERFTEDKQKKIPKQIRWIITFIIINILWLLFRSDSIKQWGDIIHRICSLKSFAISYDLKCLFLLPERVFLIRVIPFLSILFEKGGFWMMMFTFSALLICCIPENNYKNMEKISWSNVILSSIAFVTALTSLGYESIFVYFNF